MRQPLLVAASAVAGLLFLTVLALAGEPARPEGSSEVQKATVLMRDRSCVIRWSQPLAAGLVVFSVENRSSRARRFSVAGRRTAFVMPGRRAVLRAILRADDYPYVCQARGTPRSIHRGVLSINPPPPPEARIGVRGAEFYDRITGERWVPRGANYIRLWLRTDASGARTLGHSTFVVGVYDAARAEAALAAMEATGYNAVRVFFSIDCVDACLGDPATKLLRQAYLRNVADFVKRAKAHGVQVMLVIDYPANGTVWVERINRNCCPPFTRYAAYYLPRDAVDAQSDFYRAVVIGLLGAGMPADGVFAYELRNEVFFENDQPPLTLTSGTVTSANGSTYDLASAIDRRRLIEDSIVFWADEIVKAIHSVLPTALVTAGFFGPQEPHAWRVTDPRITYTNKWLAQSSVDFFDFHMYPDVELSLPQFMDNFGITGRETKPVIMGEYGGRHRPHPTASYAAQVLQRWQQQSCAYGFDGWLLWTWDTEEQPRYWSATDEGGLIGTALSPKQRPDPCAAPD